MPKAIAMQICFSMPAESIGWRSRMVNSLSTHSTVPLSGAYVARKTSGHPESVASVGLPGAERGFSELSGVGPGRSLRPLFRRQECAGCLRRSPRKGRSCSAVSTFFRHRCCTQRQRKSGKADPRTVSVSSVSTGVVAAPGYGPWSQDRRIEQPQTARPSSRQRTRMECRPIVSPAEEK